MVIRATDPEIDWSTFPEDDGEPMAETLPNAVQMVDLQWTLQTLFAMQGRAHEIAVGGNQLMYYNEHDGRDHISPDVYVILDRRPPPPPSWKTWIEGKFPDIVFEISSPSSADEDLSLAPKGKRRLYAQLRVREYYVYDPQQEMEPPLLGFELRDGRLEPLPRLESGGIVSPLLRTELRPLPMPETERRPAGIWLRVLDPTTGQPIPIAEEEHRYLQMVQEQLGTEEQARLHAEQRTINEEQARLLAEQRVLAEEQARLGAERRAADEEQARLAAEERAAQAETRLQALLAQVERRQGPEPTTDHGQ